MSALVLGFIRRLYAAAVWLYPWRFRAAFGAEMLGVFAEALAGAAQQGAGRVLALCAREATGLVVGLLEQYGRACGEAWARLRAQAVEPSWAQALAATVPGLLIVSGYWVFRFIPGEGPQWLIVAGWALAGGFLALGASAARRGWRHTTWTLPALGLLACLAFLRMAQDSSANGWVSYGPLFVAALSALGMTHWRGLRLPRATWALLGVMVLLGLARATRQVMSQAYFGSEDPGAYRLYLFLAALMPAAVVVVLLVVGRLAARWHGLGAVLLLLGPCAALIDVLVDPTYGVRSSPVPGQALLALVLRTLLYGGLLVAAPLWLLRARTAAGQVGGVLAALGVALAAVIVIPLVYWRQQVLDLFVLAQLTVGVAAALAAYASPTAVLPLHQSPAASAEHTTAAT
jgi:hypothetical protein